MNKINGWKLYKESLAFQYAECFWQKEIDKEVYACIVMYKFPDRIKYDTDLRMELDNKLSIMVKIFAFNTLDFDYIESKILEVYNKLK